LSVIVCLLCVGGEAPLPLSNETRTMMLVDG